jgi:hypothetical protein
MKSKSCIVDMNSIPPPEDKNLNNVPPPIVPVSIEV